VCMKALKRHNLSLTSPIGVALFAMVLFWEILQNGMQNDLYFCMIHQWCKSFFKLSCMKSQNDTSWHHGIFSRANHWEFIQHCFLGQIHLGIWVHAFPHVWKSHTCKKNSTLVNLSLNIILCYFFHIIMINQVSRED
jgi:hypothetical protein